MNWNPARISTHSAGLVVGLAFLSSLIIVVVIDDFLLSNFVIPGDVETLARDIQAQEHVFRFAAVAYLIVLLLDAIIALSLYVILTPFNRTLALLTAGLRLLYAGILAMAVIALLIQLVSVQGYANFKLLGYVFFTLHLFVLGLSVFRSGYVPKFLGVLLIIASLTYSVFFVDLAINELVELSMMLVMASAELALCVWLLLKRHSLPD